MTTTGAQLLPLIALIFLDEAAFSEALLCHVCGADRTNSTALLRAGLSPPRCEEANYYSNALSAKYPIQDGWGQSPISCKHNENGPVMKCAGKQPFCLMVASNVCVGRRIESDSKFQSDNICDKNYFYCWQKGCGDLAQIRKEFLPNRTPGCKFYDHPTSSKDGVDVKRTVVCVCDKDKCNSDPADLTGETLPAPFRDMPYPTSHTTGLNIVKDAVHAKKFKILDPKTTEYRQPSEWERVFLMEPGEERDFAIASLFNEQYSRRKQIRDVSGDPVVTYDEHGMPTANRNKLEPGVSHDLEDRSLKVTIPNKYYREAQADEASHTLPATILASTIASTAASSLTHFYREF